MSWTYSPDLGSDLDLVRFAIGDTDTDDQLLSDEEIAYLLTDSTVNAAAAAAADALAARFSRAVDRQVGNLRISYSQRAASFTALAVRLRGAAAPIPTPFAGGISAADKYTRTTDTDRVRPMFAREPSEYQRSERYGD